MPKDPYMLLSYINTQLRDRYPTLDELAASEGADKTEIENKLESVGYRYDEEKNCFVACG